MSLGLNIKKLRLERNMTQEDLADLLNTTVKSVSRWENEVTYPDITILPLLANIFETTVDDLLDVEKVKMDEYFAKLKKEANEYASKNELDKELELWKTEYNKFPNNEDICMNYARVMTIFNVMENKVVYNEELIKLLERIIDKSINHNYRSRAIRFLADLYSMLNDNAKADFYAKKLTDSYFFTYDVVRTHYLKGDEMLKAIQENTLEFISEISREAEHIIFNPLFSLEYRKSYLEKVMKLNEMLNGDDDYGYNVSYCIFTNITYARMITQTSNNKEEVYECFNKIKKAISYILNFKPHKSTSPLISTMNIEHIGSYAQVLLDLKNNIIKEMNLPEFNEYKETKEYLEVIELANLLKDK